MKATLIWVEHDNTDYKGVRARKPRRMERHYDTTRAAVCAAQWLQVNRVEATNVTTDILTTDARWIHVSGNGRVWDGRTVNDLEQQRPVVIA